MHLSNWPGHRPGFGHDCSPQCRATPMSRNPGVDPPRPVVGPLRPPGVVPVSDSIPRLRAEVRRATRTTQSPNPESSGQAPISAHSTIRSRLCDTRTNDNHPPSPNKPIPLVKTGEPRPLPATTRGRGGPKVALQRPSESRPAFGITRLNPGYGRSSRRAAGWFPCLSSPGGGCLHLGLDLHTDPQRQTPPVGPLQFQPHPVGIGDAGPDPGRGSLRNPR